MRQLCVLALLTCAVVYPAIGSAQRGPDLHKPAAKEWPTNGGDWSNTRYSTLTQINRNNVKNLKGTGVSHDGSGGGGK
jgi:glucose dehydrogenase